MESRKIILIEWVISFGLILAQCMVFCIKSVPELMIEYLSISIFSFLFHFIAYRKNNFYFLFGTFGTVLMTGFFDYFIKMIPVLMYIEGGMNLAALILCFIFSRYKTVTHPKMGNKDGILISIVFFCMLVANVLSFAIPSYRVVPLQNDKYYDQECLEQGKIEEITYPTYIYDENGNRISSQEKRAYIYLPHQYSEEKKYDIMYLLHGGGENCDQWMVNQRMDCNKNTVDHLIADGKIPPIIIVMPSFNFYNDYQNEANRYTARNTRGHEGYVDSALIFQYELRNELIPYVEQKYSTYADKDVSQEKLIQSRAHRAMGGLSRGSITTIKSGICSNLDYISRFSCFSGTDISYTDFIQKIDNDYNKNFDIKQLCFASGTLDHCFIETRQLYTKLKSHPRFKKGENLHLYILPYQNHYDYQWPVDLFNTLPVLFR